MSTGSIVLASGAATVSALFWALSCNQVVRPQVANARILWQLCACMCAGIALSSAFDLDSILLAWLRSIAKISGWYVWRRPLQAIALMVGGLCLWMSLGTVLALKSNQAPWPRSSSVALIACLILVGMWWSKLVSWHSMDTWMNWRLHGIGLGRWIELLALCLGGASGVVEWCQRWTWR
jgi:hypothetical protein